MASVKSLAEDIYMSVDETVEASLEHAEDRHDIERESLSKPLVNVSQDMRLIVTTAKPQACPHSLSPSKFVADVISSEEYSQAPTSSATVVFSQRPSPEFFMSLGIKVRDFAYESTLPAIVPVPRVPRQVQPAPRALKRLQREWDDKEGPLNSLSPVRPLSGQTGTKKPRSLEREPTEPLQEPVVQHTRTLERITVKRVCSIRVAPPSRSTLPTTSPTRFSASPPTSPLTPPLSHFASQGSELVQTSSAFPFVVHVENPSMIPASQLDSESQPLSLHPVLYTRFTLDSRSSPGCSSAPSPPQGASPAPPISSFLELPSPTKESGADPRVRKRRGPGTPPPSNRYQLRQRPVPSPRVSTLSRCSHQANSTSRSLPRQTRRMR